MTKWTVFSFTALLHVCPNQHHLLFGVTNSNGVAVVNASSTITVQVDSVSGQIVVEEDPADKTKSSNADTNAPGHATECGIWLAPSTIPGAGLGMYAGRRFEEGEELQEDGDVAISIVDIVNHNSRPEMSFLWDEYTWNAASLNMNHEGHVEVNVASPGFGAASNSFLPLYNVDEWNPELTDFGLHRSRDPGAGAFTAFHNRQSSAKRDINAGEELFVSYGADWFRHRPQLGPIPLFRDLDDANLLVQRWYGIKRKVPHVSQDILDAVWDLFVRRTPFNESRVIGSFHHDDKEELRLLKHTTLKDLRREQATRSEQWLQEHGTCADHIRAGISTIKQAGKGAFASRFLPEGTIVAQLPLIHITNRSVFDMYELKEEGEEYIAKTDRGVTGHQLLLNYCYGHRESTLLLCPYGPMVNYVNHNKTLANVKLRWSDPSRGNHMPHLLEQSIQLLETDATAKLGMELVATRDIAEGEEVFLDYGHEWEDSWEEHLRTWKPVEAAEKYVSAAQLNSDKTSRLRTSFEEVMEPYPENVRIKCDSTFRDVNWKNHVDDLEQFLHDEDAEWWDCEILRWKDVNGEILYSVTITNIDDYGAVTLLNDIPRIAFHFVDEPYTSDVFLENAFRHDIRIPDDIFPSAWRNSID